MSEENKAFMRRFYEELFNSKNLDVLDQYLASSFVDHNPAPGQNPGLAGAKEMIGAYLSGFPDLQASVDFQVAEGDIVVSRLTMSGTQTGDFPGVPATGKPVTFTVMDAARISDAKVAEHWGNEDTMGMLQQLGVIPSE